MAYTHILLDLDGTLFDFAAAQQNAFYRAMDELGVAADEPMLIRYDKINHSMWKLLEKGQIEKPRLLYERFALFFSEYGIVRDEKLANRLYLQNLAQSAMLLDGALHTMERLYGSFVLVAVTNGVAWSQKNRLAQSGLDKFFDRVFISEELGCEKPQLRFFEQVMLSYPGVDKRQMLLVGDSLSADIQGGLNAGIDTCWVNPQATSAGAIIPNYQIATVKELPSLLMGEERQYVYQGKSAATISGGGL